MKCKLRDVHFGELTETALLAEAKRAVFMGSLAVTYFHTR